jgi:hypothetical protein
VPKRLALPERRLAVTERLAFEGRVYLVGVGFYPSGRVGEIFLDGTKIGSEAERLLDDACVLASLMLQGGLRAAELAGHLGREGTSAGTRSASALGAALEAAARLEAEAGAGIREAHEAAARGAQDGEAAK